MWYFFTVFMGIFVFQFFILQALFFAYVYVCYELVEYFIGS